MREFIVVHKSNKTYSIGGDIETLKAWYWGKRINDYRCFEVVNGGLEEFYIPCNLSELDKFKGAAS